MKDVKKITTSSTISEITYDDKTKILSINFIGSGTYIYFEVPKEVYEEMKKAHSAGKFFYAKIKGKYTFERINES